MTESIKASLIVILGAVFIAAVFYPLITAIHTVEAAKLAEEDARAEELLQLSDRLTRAEQILSELDFNLDKPLYSKIVTVTSYTSRRKETDSTPYITANNGNVRPGGIAVSRDLLKLLGGFGAKVTLKKYGTFVVNDVMNKRFTNSVDIWCGELTAANLHGRREGVKMLWQEN